MVNHMMVLGKPAKTSLIIASHIGMCDPFEKKRHLREGHLIICQILIHYILQQNYLPFS